MLSGEKNLYSYINVRENFFLKKEMWVSFMGQTRKWNCDIYYRMEGVPIFNEKLRRMVAPKSDISWTEKLKKGITIFH